MATVQVTEAPFEATAQPGAIPAAALDEIVKQVRALDMNEVRRGLDEQESQRAVKGG